MSKFIDKSKYITLLLVDDHLLVRTAIKGMIERSADCHVVAEASTGEQALACVRQFKPNVVLMDVRMPGMGGLESTIRLRHISPDSKVLMLTACEDINFVQRFLRAGACGYLTKSVNYKELISAIRTVNAGERYLTDELASQLALGYVSEDTVCPFMALTNREWQLCLMLINSRSVQSIADILHLTPKTVNSYRYRIFNKLNVSNDVELTHLAAREGLLEED